MMTERVASKVEKWATMIIVFCSVGTILCLGGYGFLQIQVAGQASAGAEARRTQMLRQPVAEKVYVDAYLRGVITGEDLACFRDSANCDAP